MWSLLETCSRPDPTAGSPGAALRQEASLLFPVVALV